MQCFFSIDFVHGGLWFPEACIDQDEDGHSEGAEKIAGQLFEPYERRETGLQKCEDPPGRPFSCSKLI